jgi:GTP-binding protein HflX
MKLEMDRRVLRDEIVKLKRRIGDIAARRAENRKRRRTQNVPTISLVGYTNAGKSTLFNALTGAGVLAENLLFATLDTTTRRARLPGGRECVFIDTVGFIKDLPEDLVDAFRATIDEIEGSHLLLHVVDAANPAAERQVETVQSTLTELGFGWIPHVILLNKADAATPDAVRALEERTGGVAVCALRPDDVARVRRLVEERLGTPA